MKIEIKQGRLQSRPHCPTCKTLLDSWTAMDDKSQPTPGDISVCFECAEVLEFTENLMLKIADADEIAECDFVQLGRAQKIVKARKNKK